MSEEAKQPLVPACGPATPAAVPPSGETLASNPLGADLPYFRGRDVAGLVKRIEEIGPPKGFMPDGSVLDSRIIWACCATLVAGPQYLGSPSQMPPGFDRVIEVLTGPQQEKIVEARICRLWNASAFNQAPDGAADQWAELGHETASEPVKSLTYLALAYLGKRRTLAGLMPASGPLSLAQADACLESIWPVMDWGRFIERLTPCQDSFLSSDTDQAWRQLLRAEVDLLAGRPNGTTEGDLKCLLSLAPTEAPRNYDEVVVQRISLRAVAALIRLRLAREQNPAELFGMPAGQRLPAWEREHLQALTHWQCGEIAAARSGMDRSFKFNPHQTAVRVALATLQAGTQADSALAILQHPEPSREMLAVRATVLARAGRFTDAEQCLAPNAEEPVGAEAARFAWRSGREQLESQQYALRTALAEHRKDWPAASHAWSLAVGPEPSNQMLEARKSFAVKLELKSLPFKETWRRSQLIARLRRWLAETGSRPLRSDELFLRAVASLEVAPEAALRDFQTLLQRSAWMNAELSCGGGRLMFVGDCLLELGHVAEAVVAYQAASTYPSDSLRGRLAVARVCCEVERKATTELAHAANAALESTPANPWPQVVAAVGLLASMEPDAAMTHLTIAAKIGTPAPLNRCLRTLCEVLQNRPGNVAAPDLAALDLPKETEALVRLLAGEGPLPDRIKACLRDLGDSWPAASPADPAIMARHLVASLSAADKVEERKQLESVLKRTGLAWAMELASVIRVRAALEMALHSEWEKAHAELARLESSITKASRERV